MLLDPYAKAIIGRRKFGELGPVRCPRLSCISTSALFHAGGGRFALLLCADCDHLNVDTACMRGHCLQHPSQTRRSQLKIALQTARGIVRPLEPAWPASHARQASESRVSAQDVKYGPDGALGLARTWPQHACALPSPEAAFDWEGDRPLNTPMEDLVVYEMHVRGFTWDRSSGVSSPGADHLRMASAQGIQCPCRKKRTHVLCTLCAAVMPAHLIEST